MPVLATSDEITPRSALRHRPILEAGKRSATPATTTPIVQRASRIHSGEAETNDDIAEWSRDESGEAAHTKGLPGIAPASKRPAKPLPSLPHTETAKAKQKIVLQAHPLLYLGLGMLAMLLLWIVLGALFGWVNTFMDDIHYGRPRTFQMDAWVGHNEQAGTPSHFIAVNLNRHIEIIEIPGGDATHTRIYVGPQLYGANDELVPVTLAFADLNGDHKTDMVVTFQQSRVVYINDQGGFRPLLPSERPQVEQALQRLSH
jgi:hypothetical protein